MSDKQPLRTDPGTEFLETGLFMLALLSPVLVPVFSGVFISIGVGTAFRGNVVVGALLVAIGILPWSYILRFDVDERPKPDEPRHVDGITWECDDCTAQLTIAVGGEPDQCSHCDGTQWSVATGGNADGR